MQVKEDSPHSDFRAVSPSKQVKGQKAIKPPTPLGNDAAHVSMYIVGGEGPHREGQPGFAVLNRKGIAVRGRAKLKFTKKLTTMEDEWSPEELVAGRRLVKFYRRQTAAKIEVHFHPLSPESYDPDSVVVSCIWNPKLKIRVVTYSDIIYSLTAFIMTTLGPEELGRLARFLEFYEPDSFVASPTDDDEEDQDFYGCLLSLEDPRPRRNERDIRYYPWSAMEAILTSLVSTYRPYTYSFRPIYPNLPLFNKALGIASATKPYSPTQTPLLLHYGTFPTRPVSSSRLLTDKELHKIVEAGYDKKKRNRRPKVPKKGEVPKKKGRLRKIRESEEEEAKESESGGDEGDAFAAEDEDDGTDEDPIAEIPRVEGWQS